MFYFWNKHNIFRKLLHATSTISFILLKLKSLQSLLHAQFSLQFSNRPIQYFKQKQFCSGYDVPDLFWLKLSFTELDSSMLNLYTYILYHSIFSCINRLVWFWFCTLAVICYLTLHTQDKNNKLGTLLKWKENLNRKLQNCKLAISNNFCNEKKRGVAVPLQKACDAETVKTLHVSQLMHC